MKIRARFSRSQTGWRGAFTLVELMIVITIIAALMALTASAIFKFLGTQQAANTQSTLDRTQSQLGRAWSKVKDDAKQSSMTEPAYTVGVVPAPTAGQTAGQWIQQYLGGGNDANVANRTRTIYIKLCWRRAFPMNFAEALNVPYQNPELANWGLPTIVPASPLQPLPAYVNYLASQGIASVANGGTIGGPNYTPQPYESSVCLLMALQRGVSGAGINPEQLTSGGAAGAINSNSSPSLLNAWGPNVNVTFLSDAWGRPVFFSRFPAGCPILNPNGPQPGANDPGDPQGYLNSTSSAWPQGSKNLFSMLALQMLAPSPPGQINSFKLAPMVASGGMDNWVKSGALTLDPITFAPTSAGSGVIYSNP